MLPDSHHARGSPQSREMGAFYWQMISDALKSEGFSVDWNHVPGPRGGSLWRARSSRGNEQWTATAEELSVALLELEKATRIPQEAGTRS